MENNTKIIRIEIIRILHENGRIKGSELVKRVKSKVGSEKLVYREISSLVESGDIEKTIHSKSHIEYELVNLSESVNNQLKILHKELQSIIQELKKFTELSNQTKINFNQRIRTIIHFIHIVQSIDSIIRLLSYYPQFKKDKMFSQINRKKEDCWNFIMNFINCQLEEEFLNQILSNIRLTPVNSRMSN